MKYNCLVIEDNLIERDLLEMYLDKINILKIETICENAAEALKVLSTQPIDIVFSDIDMPDISGIELLKGLKHPPVFIFITSHLEHAAESYDLDVLDFIVKPVSIERLMKSVNKAVEYLDLKKKVTPTAIPKKEEDFYFLKDSKGYSRLNPEDIVYIEGLGDFSKLHTSDGQAHTALINLKNLALQLPGILVRVHKQYLINFSKILSVSTHDILLEGGCNIPLSPSYRDELLQLIQHRTLTRTVKNWD
ncbi:LytTR family DNA-binding domain-containing protein [Chitinophaga sp. sic0106]|uniref:LytR/AlgR family response regulator transcription factor n=1 Tax=Chitinophaga sp. sic0106 TaxID=2854785 RepID=UPI001C47E629|nr:LytTR family DNA-binding domain-containing protein [Chitinophaga sp. sic0106]MBV7532465.1 LytTR family DNA-binding domain-containing protein [Chitinophaga sp. sic0106]